MVQAARGGNSGTTAEAGLGLSWICVYDPSVLYCMLSPSALEGLCFLCPGKLRVRNFRQNSSVPGILLLPPAIHLEVRETAGRLPRVLCANLHPSRCECYLRCYSAACADIPMKQGRPRSKRSPRTTVRLAYEQQLQQQETELQQQHRVRESRIADWPAGLLSRSQLAPGAHHQVGQVPARLQVFAQEHAQRQGSVQNRSQAICSSVLRCPNSPTAKLILVSGNCPPLRRSEIEYYAMLSKTPVHLYAGSNVALGTAAGKLFRVG